MSSDITRKPRRKRAHIDQVHAEKLEKLYKINATPTSEQKNDLANTIRMDSKAVQIWFQNRRYRSKVKAKLGFTDIHENQQRFNLHHKYEWMKNLAARTIPIIKLRFGSWSQFAEVEDEMFLTSSGDVMSIFIAPSTANDVDSQLCLSVPLSSTMEVVEVAIINDLIMFDIELASFVNFQEAVPTEKGKSINDEALKTTRMQITLDDKLLSEFIALAEFNQETQFRYIFSRRDNQDSAEPEQKEDQDVSTPAAQEEDSALEIEEEQIMEFPQEHLDIIKEMELAIFISESRNL